jgi:hypothetical protein
MDQEGMNAMLRMIQPDHKPRSVSDYTAEELVSRAVRNARPHACGESPRWVAIQDTFALGSTYSIQLCRIHGLDPEEKVSGPRCISCNP